MKKSSRRRTPYLMLIVLTCLLLIYRGCGSPSARHHQDYREIALSELLTHPQYYDGETLLVTGCYLDGGVYLYSRGVYQLRPTGRRVRQLVFTSHLLPFGRGTEVQMLCQAKILLDTDGGYILILREIATRAADPA